AANILRKVATQLGLDLARVGRAVLTLPKRYGLDSLSKSYRKQGEEARLQPAS
ncbi:MAG: transposase, partial [Leptolyngbyaceae cyanobacterium RU_5_1]|nr:transposase [Leptolyngbyaceae cyanobacterium RU_5_1]